MARAKRKVRAKADPRVGPTESQAIKAVYVSAGMAHRRVPMIDQMLKRSQITHKEHAALSHYHDQACLAQTSPVKSCLDRSVSSGNGHGPSAAVISAMLEVARIEKALGQLKDIAHAVAVDDKSVSQWCIERYGGRERYNGQGKFIAMVPVNERFNVSIATQELRMAARRICR